MRPSTVLATINEQAKEHRWVVHLLHYVPERRSQEIDIIEDVIPLYDLKVSVRVPEAVRSVAAFSERGRTLFEEFGRWEIASPDGIEKGEIADMEARAKGRRRVGSPPVVGRHAVNGVNAWQRAKRCLSQNTQHQAN